MLSEEYIRIIFGLKLKNIRTQKKLSLSDLANASGLSVSYLNEIEKGKKYPKTAKIGALAEALQVGYDELVSLKLDKNMAPIGEILESNILKELPLELFGIETSRLIEMIANAPVKLNAFISTIMKIARNYDMREEHFYFAALRSYQEMHENFFADIGKMVDQFTAENQLTGQTALLPDQLAEILCKRYNYVINNNTLEQFPELSSLRSLTISGQPNIFALNPLLSDAQKAFALGRELGYNYLQISERSWAFPGLKPDSFDEVLNNFKASYFSVALLINRETLMGELNQFFNREDCQPEELLRIMQRFNATPEMFFHRLTNILPRHYGLNNLFFLRVNNRPGTGAFAITKELHLNNTQNALGNERNEHYCRRWVAIDTLQKLEKLHAENPGNSERHTIAAVQRSRYLSNDNEFLCFTIARPMFPTLDFNCSVTIGILVNAQLKKKIKFWEDPAIPLKFVNETCERCAATDCVERAAPPLNILQKEKAAKRKESIESLRIALQKSEKAGQTN